MGVDIAFHIEVRHNGKWHAFIWQTPMGLEKYPDKEDEGKDWKNNMCCYSCRYYHFEDLIHDSPGAICNLPEDCSDEIRKELEEYNTGYMPFEDLIHFCDKAEKDMLFNLSRSKECQITKTLRRIEKTLRNKSIPKSLETDDDDHSNMTLKEIWDEYQYDFGCPLRLRDIVWGLMEENHYWISDSDIRLVYCIG